MTRVNVSRLMVAVACGLFLLAAFGVGAGWPFSLVPLGLAVWAAGSLVA